MSDHILSAPTSSPVYNRPEPMPSTFLSFFVRTIWRQFHYFTVVTNIWLRNGNRPLGGVWISPTSDAHNKGCTADCLFLALATTQLSGVKIPGVRLLWPLNSIRRRLISVRSSARDLCHVTLLAPTILKWILENVFTPAFDHIQQGVSISQSVINFIFPDNRVRDTLL